MKVHKLVEPRKPKARKIKPITSAQLERAGKLLFGDSWKQPMATALGMSWIQMHRYSDGTALIPKYAVLAIIGVGAIQQHEGSTLVADLIDIFGLAA